MSETQDVPRPIVVVGYMRSGTTLLQNVFAKHPDVYGVQGETDVFGRLPLLRRAFPDLSEDKALRQLIAAFARGMRQKRAAHEDELLDPPALAEVKEPASFLEGIWEEARRPPREHARTYRIVAEHFARRAGKSFWVKKGLAYTTSLGDMVSALPGLRLAGIVRDPRDVLASKKTRRTAILKSDRFDARERRRQHTRRNYDPLWDALAWRTALRAMHRAERERRICFHMLRYEDLVARPQGSVRKMCEVLGLPFEAEMIEVNYRNSSEEAKRSDTEAGRTSPGIQADSVARWRGVLPLADVAVCQRVTRAEMARHKYAPADVPRHAQARLPLVLLRSAGRFVVRLYGKWAVGGRRRLAAALRNDWQRLKRVL